MVQTYGVSDGINVWYVRCYVIKQLLNSLYGSSTSLEAEDTNRSALRDGVVDESATTGRLSGLLWDRVSS